MKFEVGQVWKDRSGTQHRIIAVDGRRADSGKPRPVIAESESGDLLTLTPDGKFYNNGDECQRDLVERVVPTAKRFVCLSLADLRRSIPGEMSASCWFSWELADENARVRHRGALIVEVDVPLE
jgi:hypothetical protein